MPQVIRIQRGDQRGACFADPQVSRCRNARFSGSEQPYAVIVDRLGFDKRCCLVSRAIVDDDDLDGIISLGQSGYERATDKSLAIMYRNND
jgi:hypothetical protein